MGTDVKAAFEKIASIGFKNIETASNMIGPYYGMTPRELRKLIEDLGMKWISQHVGGAPFRRPATTPQAAAPQAAAPQPAAPQAQTAQPRPAMPSFPNLRENLQQLVDESAEAGLEYLICASTPIGTVEDINASIETFIKAGEACKKAGIQFAYHNHATEWDLVDGKAPFDRIMSATDKKLVKFEIDLAWATKAKQNPVELFNKYPGRVPCFHFKDFDLAKNTIVCVGDGNVDFKQALSGASKAGMKYIFYEQDTAQSWDDVTKSFNKIKEILG
jgi:sugar phosphate isomerase/epimerase